jgi:hypothetical protein
MEPLKPDEKQHILATRPEAEPADIEEYERLLAERFARDPSQPPHPSLQARDARLRQLYIKLFGPPDEPPPDEAP